MWVYNLQTGAWENINPAADPTFPIVNNPGIPIPRAYGMFWTGLNGTFYFYGGIQGIFCNL
jgi:hypothetical protein